MMLFLFHHFQLTQVLSVENDVVKSKASKNLLFVLYLKKPSRKLKYSYFYLFDASAVACLEYERKKFVTKHCYFHISFFIKW